MVIYQKSLKEKMPSKNTASKAVLPKLRREEDFHRQTKDERVHYHKACLTRNAEISSLHWSEWYKHKNIKHTIIMWYDCILITLL